MYSVRELFFEIFFVILFLSAIAAVCMLGRVRFSTAAISLIFGASIYSVIVWMRIDMRETDRKLQ